MPLTPDLLERARKNREALIDVLSDRYPCLYRMSYALIGREDAAGGVVAFVLRQATVAVKNWSSPADVMRWFMHHSLLTIRRVAERPVDLTRDPLIRRMQTANAYYPAFVRALRALPIQQREAFLLHHGEQLDHRGLGVAMDCSVQAASSHLREATNVLSAYAGPMFTPMTAQLAQAYQQLAPPREMIAPAIRADLRRGGYGRRFLRKVVLIFLWCVLAFVVYLVIRIVPMLRW